MWPFKKKKKPEQQTQIIKYQYSDWDKDLGFLIYILNRKKNIVEKFIIDTYNDQKSSNDFLTDEEIEPVVTDICKEVTEGIGENYKKFLIDKYFGSQENLIKYISEDVYVSVVAASIEKNSGKISRVLSKKLVESVSSLNKSEK